MIERSEGVLVRLGIEEEINLSRPGLVLLSQAETVRVCYDFAD
jgi:hypothetical protein